MVNEGRSPLAGRIEADEVIVGGPVQGKTGRGVTKAEHSTLVSGAVEVIAKISTATIWRKPDAFAWL